MPRLAQLDGGRVSVGFDATDMTDLREIARHDQTAVSDTVRRIVRAHLERHRAARAAARAQLAAPDAELVSA